MAYCVLRPHLRYVDYNITVGHVGYPNESLLDDPLALDLDIWHRCPWSQQERRGARTAVLLLLLTQAGYLLGSHRNMLMAAHTCRSSHHRSKKSHVRAWQIPSLFPSPWLKMLVDEKQHPLT